MYFANSFTMVCILRFLVGFGEGGEYGAGMAMIGEYFSAKRYGRVTAIASIGGHLGASLLRFYRIDLTALWLARLILSRGLPSDLSILYSAEFKGKSDVLE